MEDTLPHVKGILVERQGRKANGLRDTSYGGRVTMTSESPHLLTATDSLLLHRCYVVKCLIDSAGMLSYKAPQAVQVSPRDF